jgi:hypothetical protein
VAEYQPGSCDTLEPREAQGCIDMYYWMRYRLEGLRDLTSKKLGRPIAVMATHLPREGKWFVVLEKLNTEESKKFKADYRIVDGGPAFKATCLDEPIKKYLPSNSADPYVDKTEERFCYDIEELKREE